MSPLSSAYIASIGTGDLHPDFGSNLTYGIPYAVVPASQPKVPIHFTAYGDQSDKGPYPIPPGAPVEGGAASSGDRHVLVVQAGACKLYELYSAYPNRRRLLERRLGRRLQPALEPAAPERVDLRRRRRPADLRRADPLRRDPARRHQPRDPLHRTRRRRRASSIPATHFASSSTNPDLPPMGLRLRLKASFDISHFPRVARIILRAMKTYGLILADNGSPWYFQGATDPRWNDNALDTLKTVPGSAFEAVQTGPILHVG